MRSQLLFLELNELNLESVAFYCARGLLPTFDRLIARHGLSRTVSESVYENIEPWIQWVTVHTGKSYADHKIFRLGDIVKHDIPQIWEQLETLGLRVGAISPMNAKHRVRQPAFFVPDPWTRTQITARPILRGLYEAVVQAVNDNAQSRVTAASAMKLLVGAMVYARPANYAQYLKLAAGAHSRPWRKAMLLDLLLADVFVREVRRTRPDFATLFLNAAAHIQHHYMFSSAAYRGQRRNPEWYVRPNEDPVLEVYRLYDRIVSAVLREFPNVRLMIATGLHQDPYEDVTFYWRLRDHGEFLRKIQVPFRRVEPRMSRDFMVECESEEEARVAEQVLKQAIVSDNTPLFMVDNRGRDLFVTLTYPKQIGPELTFRIGDRVYADLHKDVAFVAIKNGHHNGIGYFLDTHAQAGDVPEEFPLSSVPDRIMSALGLSGAASRAAA